AVAAIAHLPHDLVLADAGRIEARRDQEQMLGRAFALPRLEAALGFAGRGLAAGQKLESVAAEIRARRFRRASEDQLDAITRREIRELREAEPSRERGELLARLLLVERELGEAFRAPLAPRDADHRQLIQHERASIPFLRGDIANGAGPFVTEVSWHVVRNSRMDGVRRARCPGAVTPTSRTRAGRSGASRRAPLRSRPRARADRRRAPADARSSSRSAPDPNGNSAPRAHRCRSAPRARP